MIDQTIGWANLLPSNNLARSVAWLIGWRANSPGPAGESMPGSACAAGGSACSPDAGWCAGRDVLWGACRMVTLW